LWWPRNLVFDFTRLRALTIRLHRAGAFPPTSQKHRMRKGRRDLLIIGFPHYCSRHPSGGFTIDRGQRERGLFDYRIDVSRVDPVAILSVDDEVHRISGLSGADDWKARSKSLEDDQGVWVRETQEDKHIRRSIVQWDPVLRHESFEM